MYDAIQNKYIYEIRQSPMCDYMIKFATKLKGLKTADEMNKVLKKFTVLQVSWQL